jgi:Gpi18-like mannosyltransferase
VSYLVSAWLVYQCLRLAKQKEQTALLGCVIFLFNPLIIIEVLVSAHNDIVMMVFALAAYYLYLKQQKVVAFGLYAISVAIKLMTAPLGLLFLISWKRPLAIGLLGFSLIMVLTRREFLPWYAIWIIPFTALLPQARWLQLVIVSLSLGLVSRYLPVVWFGDYGQLTILWRDRVLFGVTSMVSLLGLLLLFWVRRQRYQSGSIRKAG